MEQKEIVPEWQEVALGRRFLIGEGKRSRDGEWWSDKRKRGKRHCCESTEKFPTGLLSWFSSSDVKSNKTEIHFAYIGTQVSLCNHRGSQRRGGNWLHADARFSRISQSLENMTILYEVCNFHWNPIWQNSNQTFNYYYTMNLS